MTRLSTRRWLAVALAAIVAADWLTKFLVQNHLRLYSRHAVIDGWVWLAHARNPGIAFSFFRDGHDHVRLPLLIAAATLGIVLAGRIALTADDAKMRLAAALVTAGALGNLGDRLMNGWVTDFIQVRWFPFVFNVADVAITIGAVLLAARMVMAEPPRGSAPQLPN